MLAICSIIVITSCKKEEIITQQITPIPIPNFVEQEYTVHNTTTNPLPVEVTNISGSVNNKGCKPENV